MNAPQFCLRFTPALSRPELELHQGGIERVLDQMPLSDRRDLFSPKYEIIMVSVCRQLALLPPSLPRADFKVQRPPSRTDPVAGG